MMTLMSILAASGNGNYFDGVAQACDMSAGEAKSVLERLCPAIATQLKAKALSDNNAFEALLDLLDEGEDLDGLTDFRHPPTHDHAAQTAGKNADAGRYIWEDPDWQIEALSSAGVNDPVTACYNSHHGRA